MRQNSVVNTLLGINVVAYLISLILNINDLMGLYYFQNPHFHVFQIVTYMFMHAGFMHIFFNMFALWMFGRLLEQVWGWRKFLTYYLVCGIGAALTQEIGQMAGVISPYAMTIGASGAVYGILLAFGMTFPNEKLFIIPIPVPIKAKYFVMGYVVIELFEGFSASDGVAHWAHLGGMLFGALMFIYWRRSRVKPQRARKMKVTYNTADNYDRSSKPGGYTVQKEDTPSEAYREEIDRILDKIRQHGYEGLTAEEKRILFDASQRK